MTWQTNPAARREILAAMKRRRRALTTLEIAHMVGKADASVRQMLYAMLRDGVVSYEKEPVGKSIAWKPTGRPLPKVVTSAAHTVREEVVSRFDGSALAAALGMDGKLGAAVTNTRTHKIEGGR